MRLRIFTLTVAIVTLTLGRAAAETSPKPSMAPKTTPENVTTIKLTSIKVGSLSLALNKDTKLEVLGRQNDSLVVKFRSSKGNVPIADTNFDPATMTVPEIAADPSGKSTENAGVVADSNSAAPSREQAATANQIAANGAPGASKEAKKKKVVQPSQVPPPPVNN